MSKKAKILVHCTKLLIACKKHRRIIYTMKTIWCGQEDSNLHGLPRHPLKFQRLCKYFILLGVLLGIFVNKSRCSRGVHGSLVHRTKDDSFGTRRRLIASPACGSNLLLRHFSIIATQNRMAHNWLRYRQLQSLRVLASRDRSLSFNEPLCGIRS